MLTDEERTKKWYRRVWPLLNSTFTIFLLGTVVLGLFTRYLDERRKDEEQRIALESQRTALLEGYFDRMERQIDRLVSLDPSNKAYEVEKKAVRANVRGRTLALLPQLDAERKGLVIDFLYGSDLLLLLNDLLRDADLREADLNGRILSGADLSGANLRQANLSRADLSNTNLSGADLRGADLSFANLFSAKTDSKTQIDPKWQLVLEIVTYGAEGRDDLKKVDLSRANLSFVNLHKADLSEANLSEADLSSANLSSAILRGADLREANLSGADLPPFSSANLSSAILRGADLREANLSGADLREAKYDNNTIWPDGFDPKAAGAVLDG